MPKQYIQSCPRCCSVLQDCFVRPRSYVVLKGVRYGDGIVQRDVAFAAITKVAIELVAEVLVRYVEYREFYKGRIA